MAEESAWLIEWPPNDNRPQLVYWAGPVGDNGTWWTTDPSRAIRFSRSTDAYLTAEAVMAGLTDHLRIAEHMWMDAAVLEEARAEAQAEHDVQNVHSEKGST